MVLPEHAGLWNVVIVAATVMLALLVLAPVAWAELAVMLTAAGTGVFLRIHVFATVAIHPNTADMLPLVQGALDRLLLGQSPYTTYSMPWPQLRALQLHQRLYLGRRLQERDLRRRDLPAPRLQWRQVGGPHVALGGLHGRARHAHRVQRLLRYVDQRTWGTRWASTSARWTTASTPSAGWATMHCTRTVTAQRTPRGRRPSPSASWPSAGRSLLE